MNATYLASDCILMTFRTINFTVSQNNGLSTSFLKYKTGNDGLQPFTKYTCLPKNDTFGDVSATMEFEGEEKTNVDQVTLTMIFNKNNTVSADGSYWWKLLDVGVKYTVNKQAEQNIHLDSRYYRDTFTAPDNMSFACGQTHSVIDFISKKSNATVTLQFTKLQVQPFGVVSNNSFFPTANFSMAAECVGWYTGPIWTGLIVTLLLVSILSFGLAMISQVTTMDRFDDPKRKTISVPQEST